MIDTFRQIRILSKVKDLWIGLFILKAGLSFLLILPFYLANNSVLSSSRFSKGLIDNWDFSVISEMFFGRGELIAEYLLFVLIGLIIYVALVQFINGGLYYLFVSGRIDDINWREFFAECGSGFNTHIKITIMMIIIYALLLFAGMFFINIISMAAGYLVGTPVLIMSLFKLLILTFIILAASIFSDSIRATATVYPDKTFREFLQLGSDYFKNSLKKIFVLYIVTFIPFFVFWLLIEWSALAVVGAVGGLIGIFAEFLLFQLTSFFRNGQKLWYFGCFGKNFRSVHQGRFLPEQASLNL